MLKNERSYYVENDGLFLVIDNIIERYTFTLSGSNSDSINPDILGYIFEKTINFISGTGTNEQKMKGAYYTPDDVVRFIVDKTLTPVLHRKILEGLKKAGWDDKNLGRHSI
ncbi:SAM-dependent DNA methyltransferase [Archaeoglobus neptunius]|uniref:SAM-dependent DNA methyltransferase n=1 Tax=Archaeoglobus neptunius TaxID=2798580 RepID=UPI0019286193|nr:SAM-dependent DNA methyltransferase [Archaeoglobus neptunius]